MRNLRSSIEKDLHISIVVPVFNEEEVLNEFHKHLLSVKEQFRKNRDRLCQ